MWIVERLLALIAPHTCQSCGVEGVVLCQECAITLPSIPSRCYRCNRATNEFRTCATCRRSSRLYAVWPVTTYRAAKGVSHKLKYERAQAAAADVARAIARRATPAGAHFVITHAPTAPARVRERGYDQAALVAKALSQITGMPYVPLLVRSGNDRQVWQKRAGRREQMKEAFRAAQYPYPRSQHILLVDDVLTTGATCEAAALALCKAGAYRVSAVVFAVA